MDAFRPKRAASKSLAANRKCFNGCVTAITKWSVASSRRSWKTAIETSTILGDLPNWAATTVQREILSEIKRRINEAVTGTDLGGHSDKPAVFYEIIERYFPTLPKIELHARSAVARPGWDVWGLEAPIARHESQAGFAYARANP